MAESAVSFLVNQLSVWLQQEQNLLLGLEQEADYIRDELGNMRAFLRVADAKQESDPKLKEWVRQVNEISYDTEDVLEKYMLRFAYPRYGANGFSRYIKRIGDSVMSLKARHQIASEIQTIKSRIENVSRFQQRFRDMYAIVNQGSSSTPTSYEWYDDDNRGDALLSEEADVVGIEKPKQQLLDWLLSANDGLKVISVVGNGGLGKTTMVKKVYNETSVMANFDCHVWVTVSASITAEHLLRDIIKRLLEGKQQPPQEFEAMNADDLKEMVYQFLQRKTYMIVLDDVWEIDAWESIRYAFPRISSRGCIIITTRSSSIGNAACSETNGHVYNLEPLNEEESEKLLYKTAFSGNSCPPCLKKISQSILKRCMGLPLVIAVIGGLLATKNNIYDEWQKFERNIGLELQGDNLNRMMKLLSLSYYDLPYYLKSCFLYLSIFPEDALFEKWRIIRLWIAEGFVEAKQGKTMEEVAEGYLNELLNRSLIQVAETYDDGRPRKFRIHDILREYMISKSREHSVLAIITGEVVRWPNKIRQLAIHTTFNHVDESYNVKNLRSLLWLESIDSESGLILRKILLRGCRLLKVLDVRGAPIDSIPDEVFKLYHLKYLSLRGTNIKLMPKTIENLQNLETLDLKKSKVTELPIEILKLRKLRHLLVYSYDTVYNPSVFESIQSFKAPYPYGIGRYLTNLQKLCYIDADEVDGIKTVREIGKLTQLRRLGITKVRREDGKDLCLSLAKLINLHSLCVCSIKEGEVLDLDCSLMSPSPLPVLGTLVLKGCLEKVPEWVHSLNGLTELHLVWSRLREVPLQHLGVLPNLVCFSMYKFAYDGEELSFNSRGFQRLKKMGLGSLRGLRWIKMEEGSIPNLKQLYIEDCKLMEELPNGIEHLKDLEFVGFTNMSEKFVDGLCVQKGEEGEKWKLGRVPQVDVYNFVDDEWEWIDI